MIPAIITFIAWLALLGCFLGLYHLFITIKGLIYDHRRKTPRVGSIVIYAGDDGGYDDARSEKTLVYIGPIPNMPDHGIFADKSGKVHIGYHINEFREATEEET
jgi:hypothetical protein